VNRKPYDRMRADGLFSGHGFPFEPLCPWKGAPESLAAIESSASRADDDDVAPDTDRDPFPWWRESRPKPVVVDLDSNVRAAMVEAGWSDDPTPRQIPDPVVARIRSFKAPLRSGLVRLPSSARTCAEVHQDVARLGWPEGSWCE